MSQKDSQKKREINLEEDKDFYLSYVNKKLRNTRKKLEQIEALLTKDQSTLKPEQIEKIRSREEVVDSIKYLEELKNVYYSAYKVGLEEGKVALPERSSEVASERNDKAPEAPKVKAAQSESDGGNVNVERIREEATIQTLKKVMNLIFVGQFFNESANKEAFLSDTQSQGLASDAQVNELQRLYRLINNSSQVNEATKVEVRYTQSFEKLVDYVQASSDNSRSTRTTYEFVENVANSINFKNTLINAPKKQEEQTVIEPEVKTEQVTEEKPTETETNVILELLTNGAELLKPDTDDVNKSPENMKYLPKDIRTLKYVDEIEKEHMNNAQTNQTEAQTNGEGQIEEGALKESAEGSAQNGPEKKEEKSFRKNRYNKRDKPRTENGEKGAGPQAKRAANHKENRTSEDGGKGYEKRGYNNNYKKRNYEYEVRQYVEKKPAENKA